LASEPATAKLQALIANGDRALRILILGAGGIGGYYGGRLAKAGVDVTFLVRPRRAEQLARDGLVIKSPLGDMQLPVRTVQRETAKPGYDAIILSCKAYDLDDAIESIRPAAEGALILPQLNGMKHLDRLDSVFGRKAVLGGVAQIGITMEPNGTIRHLNKGQGFIFGERDPTATERCTALAAELAKGGFEPRHSREIELDMWEKFTFLCTLAGMCCLMRGSVGAIARTDDGKALAEEMFADCAAAAEAAGFAPRERFVEFARNAIGDAASTNEASMLRDLRRGGPVEADHIVGDMLARAKAAGRSATLLRAAYAHLQVYEAGRAKG
jgi:2-dehydropantoate 2-reductase